MKRIYEITLEVQSGDMNFSKIPAIKALRSLGGMELKDAVNIINEVISAGTHEPIGFELNVYSNQAVVDNAIANFNRTGFSIEFKGDTFLDTLNDLLYHANAEEDKEMAAHVYAVIKYYEKG